ncbi:MAG: MerR family transcriptional regulator [Formosimonas sp.]
MPTNQLTIGQLATAANVHVETIRYYQKRGLLPKLAKPMSGHTRYPAELVTRIKFIKSAQHLSFSLNDIAALLHLTDAPTDKAQARELSNERLKQITETRAHLDFIESTLTRWVSECESSRENECCPIIAQINLLDYKTSGA